jgi:high mobility group protein B1
MNANMNTQKMNEYVQAFLFLEKWNDQENQEEFSKLLPKVSKTKTTKTVKDPNKPKRGKSSYLFFCAENRPKVKEELGEDAKATEVTSALGAKWNELKNSTKASDKKKVQKYEAEAQSDKERYDAEMVDYEPPSEDELVEIKGTKKRKSAAKDPHKPKRGKSSYLFFCAENRSKVKAELGADARVTEVTSALGAKWNELKNSTKASDKKKVQKYESEAQADKERYEAEIAQYDPPSDEEILIAKKSKKLPAEKKTSEKKTSEKKTSTRKPTGYSLFCKEHRDEVKEDYPDMSANEITKVLADMWKDLEEDEQAEWKVKAADM